MDDPIGESGDERLQQLLDLEQRLQDLVRSAREDAARRIAAARAASEAHQAAAREAAERANAERARAEHLIHEQTLLAIDTAHRAALATITDSPDSRIDELARLALVRAIAGTGEAT